MIENFPSNEKIILSLSLAFTVYKLNVCTRMGSVRVAGPYKL